MQFTMTKTTQSTQGHNSAIANAAANTAATRQREAVIQLKFIAKMSASMRDGIMICSPPPDCRAIQCTTTGAAAHKTATTEINCRAGNPNFSLLTAMALMVSNSAQTPDIMNGMRSWAKEKVDRTLIA
jgi:hypothetical protein